MKNSTLKTRLLATIGSLALLASLAACTSGNTSSIADSSAIESSVSSTASETSLPEEQPAAPDAAGIATDRAGNPITIPEAVERIISLAPSTTEVLLDLGLGDKLVAVDNDSAYMFPALDADIVVLEMMSPDVEQVMVLDADIIFVSPLTAAGGDDPLAPVIDSGVCVAVIPTPDTLEGIFEDVRFIGACVGMESEAGALLDEVTGTIDEITALAATVEQPRSVLFEISAAPAIYSFGSGVYLDEVFALVGAKNVLEGQTGWIMVSEEDAVAANPDVIITNVNYIDAPVEEILSREGWENITAVANGDVYYVDNAASSLPNHKVAQAIVEIAKAIYPDVYGDI